MVAVTDVVGGWPYRAVQITLASRYIAVIGPHYLDDIVAPVPARIKFDVIAVEGHTATPKHLALGVVRHVADADLRIEVRIGVSVTVTTSVIHIKCFIAICLAVAEVIPGYM